ncbi:(2Fe-2S) ferredoxin domain-containing protein [Candidatus Gracilibacteria bacterium]|nr:(2Fe-2S) ferredoxin domain-containing protein [Candidatus Gracilibacteria bacterium]
MGKDEKLRSVEKIARAGRPCLAICAGKDCARAGTRQLLNAAQAALHEADLADQVAIEITKCQDYCDDAPVMSVVPGGLPYVDLRPADVHRIVDNHVRNGRPVAELLHKRARRKLKRV